MVRLNKTKTETRKVRYKLHVLYIPPLCTCIPGKGDQVLHMYYLVGRLVGIINSLATIFIKISGTFLIRNVNKLVACLTAPIFTH